MTNKNSLVNENKNIFASVLQTDFIIKLKLIYGIHSWFLVKQARLRLLLGHLKTDNKVDYPWTIDFVVASDLREFIKFD